jgi:hypothetical protein
MMETMDVDGRLDELEEEIKQLRDEAEALSKRRAGGAA